VLYEIGRFRWQISPAWRSAAVLAVFLFGLSPATALAAPLRANTGTVLALTGTGASSPGDPIQISSTVQADSSIQNSNLLYAVYEPGGNLVASRKISLAKMEGGDVFSDSWSTSNTPSSGTYSVTICWSTGNAENCDIASAMTNFYSVPTVGLPLALLALALLGAFVWRRRQIFEGSPA